MNHITIYKTSSCPACSQVIPILKSRARKRGVSVKVVDVENCGKPCDWIRYVPYVQVDGRTADVYKVLRDLE